jgi:hypothetical protein
MAKKKNPYNHYDNIQEAKEYIESLCEWDHEIAEEVSKNVFFSFLRDKRSPKQFNNYLKALYDEEGIITDFEEMRF